MIGTPPPSAPHPRARPCPPRACRRPQGRPPPRPRSALKMHAEAHPYMIVDTTTNGPTSCLESAAQAASTPSASRSFGEGSTNELPVSTAHASTIHEALTRSAPSIDTSTRSKELLHKTPPAHRTAASMSPHVERGEEESLRGGRCGRGCRRSGQRGQGATGAVWAREVGWAREGASHMKSQRWRLTAAGVHGDPYLEMAVYVGVKL